MNLSKTKEILTKVEESHLPKAKDLEYLLSLEGPHLDMVFDSADRVRKHFAGNGILLRGIVEFSNYCRNSCSYCGLNRNNKRLKRYRMDGDEIIESVNSLAGCGIKTVVLQSGEEDDLDIHWLAKIISKIKTDFNIAVTLSIGERSFQDYKTLKDSGADRYLLKIETSDRDLYAKLHPSMSFDNRIRCLYDLKKLGFQTGSGNIIGLKGQSLKTIANDIIFFKKMSLEMVSVGPFIPHHETELAAQARGDIGLTLKALALTRIVVKGAHMPATTALGSQEKDFRIDGLKAGANVLMPNFTPLKYKALYEIYPGKRCITEQSEACIGCLTKKAESIGRRIDYSRGDSIRDGSHSELGLSPERDTLTLS